MLAIKQIFVFPFFLPVFISSSFASSSCTTLFEQQDYSKALQKCNENARLNLPHAHFILGQLYEQGFGVTQNTDTALDYYRMAVLKNDVDAQIALGKYHSSKKNYLHGHIFFTLAIDNGSLRAVRYRDKVEQNMSIQELNLSRNYLYIIKNAINQNISQIVIN